MEEPQTVKRYYIGVDWGDRRHQVCVCDEDGEKVKEIKVAETAQDLSEIGRWLDEKRAEGFELWAAIEKPAGRIVDFLLDHGVAVYPVNPKAVDRIRDRYRMSDSKSDAFDAYVLAEFVRTDQARLKVLRPSSDKAQELKLLCRDHRRVVRHKTRLLNQLTTTLKEYYPRPLEAFGDIETEIALDFLTRYPTPAHLSALKRKQFNRFATQEHHLSKDRCEALWNQLSPAQLPVPEHVVRAKAQLTEVLIDQLRTAIKAVETYNHKVESFFASSPVALIAKTLPGGKSGTLVASIWAELGDATGRWESFHHLQAQAGVVPVTIASGKSRVVHFRFACNKDLRYALYWFAFVSLNHSEWAKIYYRQQRAQGHSHPQALRALGAKWLKIIFVMWRDHKAYDEKLHLANIALQKMRQAAA
jgi:transposase